MFINDNPNDEVLSNLKTKIADKQLEISLKNFALTYAEQKEVMEIVEKARFELNKILDRIRIYPDNKLPEEFRNEIDKQTKEISENMTKDVKNKIREIFTRNNNTTMLDLIKYWS